MNFYDSKKVLVAGGTGTIGIALVKFLLDCGAIVTVASMDPDEYATMVLGPDVKFSRSDLTEFENCIHATRNQDFVFNLVGIKGSVGIGETKVASYFYPMILFQTNLMEAAFRNDVSRFLFVSSICAYPQSENEKKEDDMWKDMPKQNDRFPGLAKRIGEIQGETYLKEHDWDAVRIVRPSNVYGPFDDFNPATAQVIPALIARMVEGENPVKVWGDGRVIRDFIYSEECAKWLSVAMEKAPPCIPINLGSGIPLTIRQITEIVASNVPNTPNIEWDKDKPTGDSIRLLNMERAKKYLDFQLEIGIDEGIKRSIDWYQNNRDIALNKGARYYGK